MTAFNSLKYISRLLLKDLETKKCTCKILSRLPNVKFYMKGNFFSSQKQTKR